MDYKYELNSDKNALIIKQGQTGRFGGVEFLVDHDSMFGSEEYSDVRLCLYDFRRGAGEQYPPFPQVLRSFKPEDVEDLCKVSVHCREARGEVLQLIDLAKIYFSDDNIAEKNSPCSSRMCLAQTLSQRLSLR